jgi:hypothetical protein
VCDEFVELAQHGSHGMSMTMMWSTQAKMEIVVMTKKGQRTSGLEETLTVDSTSSLMVCLPPKLDILWVIQFSFF